jgi:hypothetical protein
LRQAFPITVGKSSVTGDLSSSDLSSSDLSGSDLRARRYGLDVVNLTWEDTGQVPLIHQVSYPQPILEDSAAAPAAAAPIANAPKAAAKTKDSASAAGSIVQERSNVEQAVLGHGADTGPFAEMANINLVRARNSPSE